MKAVTVEAMAAAMVGVTAVAMAAAMEETAVTDAGNVRQFQTKSNIEKNPSIQAGFFINCFSVH